jgi:hypothetical protein
MQIQRDFYDQFTEEEHSLVLSFIRKAYQEIESIIKGLTTKQNYEAGGKEHDESGELVGKLNQYEIRNQELISHTMML